MAKTIRMYFPVLIDRNYCFVQHNRWISFSYMNFHFILVDEENRIDVIGLSLNNKRLVGSYLKGVRNY